MTPWPRRRLGGPGSQSGSQSTVRDRQSKSSLWWPAAGSSWRSSLRTARERLPEPLNRHWPAVVAGLAGSAALSVALLVGGGSGAGAQPGQSGAGPELVAGSSSTTSQQPLSSPSVPGASPVQTAAPTPLRTTSQRPTVKKPAKVKIPESGPGTFVRAKVDGPKVGKSSARLLRYDVRVEKNLPYDADETARQIQATLSDPRSWTGGGDWRLELVSDSRKADFTVYLATPGTVDRLCWPLRTYGRVSCQAGNRVMLNAWRWAHGAKAYDKDVSAYRQYLVNHEVGHRLGHGHVGCPAKGERAPVMMQQTKGVGACRANPWPAPKRLS